MLPTLKSWTSPPRFDDEEKARQAYILHYILLALLAVPVAMLLSNQVGMLFLEAPLAFSFSFTGILIWLVLSAGLSVLASLMPAWKAARLSVREVLSYE